jgi:uncharacterized protein YxjI
MKTYDVLENFANKENAGNRIYTIDTDGTITIQAKKFSIDDDDGSTAFTIEQVLKTNAATLRLEAAQAKNEQEAINDFLTLKGL